jgi:hypothetical protein
MGSVGSRGPRTPDVSEEKGARGSAAFDRARALGSPAADRALPPRPPAEIAPWSFPPESDGWFRAHACLNKMMAGWADALEALDSQLAAGAALAPAQAAALRGYWACFRDFLHQHHHNEDEIVARQLAARGLAVPEGMGGEHAEVVAQLGALDALAAEMLDAPGAAAARAAARAAAPRLAAFRTFCAAHFEMEEAAVYIGVIRARMSEEVSSAASLSCQSKQKTS